MCQIKNLGQILAFFCFFFQVIKSGVDLIYTHYLSCHILQWSPVSPASQSAWISGLSHQWSSRETATTRTVFPAIWGPWYWECTLQPVWYLSEIAQWTSSFAYPVVQVIMWWIWQHSISLISWYCWSQLLWRILEQSLSLCTKLFTRCLRMVLPIPHTNTLIWCQVKVTS